MKILSIAIAVSVALQQFAFGADDHVPKGYKLLYEQAFESPESLKDFAMTDL